MARVRRIAAMTPWHPGLVTLDQTTERFWATRLYDTEPGVIRAFRMYCSRLL